MFNPVQMWNYGVLQEKVGLSEKGRIYSDMAYAVLEITRTEGGV